MLKRVIEKLQPDYKNLKDHTVFLVLMGVSFFIRFPFFFRDYIDRDESTFILVAQSWVDGSLPYTTLWDIKPPIIYAFFAAIIALFGKSFIALRLTGTLIVTIIALFTYKIAKKASSKKVGFWAAISCVYLISMFGSLQGVMSEHLSMLFFMPGLFLLLQRKSPPILLTAGVLMGLALMTKINLAYPILLFGLFMVFHAIRNRNFLEGMAQSFIFGFGVLVIILLTILPYWLENQQGLWWNSVVLAPLEYTAARRYSIIKLAPICIVVGLFLLLSYKKKWLNFNSEIIQILLLAVLGVVLSFIKGGRVNGHYLIQFHPVFVILTGIAVSKLPLPSRKGLYKYVLLLLLVLPIESYMEYIAIVKNKMQNGSWYNGEGFTVPEYIRKHQLNTENILFFGYHIGYWMLNTTPPTKAATHPSNITKDESFRFFDNPRKTSMEELRYIMETIRPTTVVTRKDRLVFDAKAIAENEYIDAYLKRHYRIVATVEKAEIYQRLQ